MEKVLDIYKRPYNAAYPVVCMDESPRQLIEETRQMVPAKPGRLARHDYEYKRCGVCNIFIAGEPLVGHRMVKVTERRTKKDWAYFIEEIAEAHENAEKITLVMDNLNTHKEKSFYEAFSEDEAERILSKTEFHYTPKHASWLNAAEIEINVMDIECTDRRIEDMEILAYEVAAWNKRRNDDEKKINWGFTSENADEKLSKHYVP